MSQNCEQFSHQGFLIFWVFWGPKWFPYVAETFLGRGYNVAGASLGRGIFSFFIYVHQFLKTNIKKQKNIHIYIHIHSTLRSREPLAKSNPTLVNGPIETLVDSHRLSLDLMEPIGDHWLSLRGDSGLPENLSSELPQFFREEIHKEGCDNNNGRFPRSPRFRAADAARKRGAGQ